MENNLSPIDVKLLQSLVATTSYTHIAELLGKPVDEIKSHAQTYAKEKSIVTWQMKENARIAKKAAVKKVQPKEVSAKHSARVQAMERRIKLDVESKRKRPPSQYKTLQVDYTQLVTVRIDNKTFIYAKPGNEAAAKKAYEKNYLNKQKHQRYLFVGN